MNGYMSWAKKSVSQSMVHKEFEPANSVPFTSPQGKEVVAGAGKQLELAQIVVMVGMAD